MNFSPPFFRKWKKGLKKNGLAFIPSWPGLTGPSMVRQLRGLLDLDGSAIDMDRPVKPGDDEKEPESIRLYPPVNAFTKRACVL